MLLIHAKKSFTGNWYNGSLAAYDAINASSLANSYLDLSGNGNDITAVVAPTLGAGGWVFTGTQALNTGLSSGLIHDDLSLFVKFSGYADIVTPTVLAGSVFVSRHVELSPNYESASNVKQWRNGGNAIQDSGKASSGVIGFSGISYYFDGSLVTTGGANASSVQRDIYIGAKNTDGVTTDFCTATISSVIVFDRTLTHSEVATLSEAMP